MLPLDDAITTARNQLASWSDVVSSLDAAAFARPAAGLPGWDVERLSRHLGEAAWAQAEAFHRSRLGVVDQPALPSIPAPAAELGDRIALARNHLESAMAAYAGDDWTLVPMPFAVIPAIAAANGIVLEYGVHRYDLDRSLDRDANVDEATCAAVLGLAAGLMPMIGRPAEDEPLAYRLESPAATVDLIWDGKTWGIGEAETACIVRGDDESVTLLVMGRVGVDHPTLQVDDLAGTAGRFTNYFAGI